MKTIQRTTSNNIYKNQIESNTIETTKKETNINYINEHRGETLLFLKQNIMRIFFININGLDLGK